MKVARIIVVVMLALATPTMATLTTTTNSVSYVGNGSATSFTVPFKFIQASHLVVTVGGLTKTLNTDYTVTGTGNATGTVTFTTAPATASSVVITRVVPFTQTTSFAQNRTLDPKTISDALDLVTMEAQQNANTHAADKTAQAARDTAQDASIVGVSNSVAALNGSSQAVTSASSVLAFGSTTPRTLTSRFSDVKNVLDYNAKCDGSTDDSIAVAAAVTALPSTGGVVFFPAGVCKLNLTIAKTGVVLQGSGYGNVNTGLGGTKLIAANNAIPIIQVGDGTTTVRPARITNLLLVGDQTNATGDGISILGASDVAIDNVTVTGFGRHDITITSSATLPSSGIYLHAVTLAAARGTALNAVYGPQYVTNVSITGSHINGWSTATSYAISLDSTVLWMTATYVDIGGSAVGALRMLKSGATYPGIIANACTFDNPAGAAGTTLDVSTFAAKISRVNTWINGVYNFTGSVVFSDGTVNIQAMGRGAYLYQPSTMNPFIFGEIYFPFDETDFPTSIGLSRAGAAGSGFESVGLTGGARFNANIQQTHVALTYSASMTPAANAASIFEIIPTNGTAFTINGPTKVVQAQFLTFRIKNTFGTLGAVTWDPTYKMSAWTQPANGFSRSITFYHDGTALYEVSRTPADVPN